VATLHHLAVDEDAPAGHIDAVGGEGGHLPPAQARIGHGQDLQLPPPHPLPRRRGQGVHGRGGGDVGLVDEAPILLGVEAVALDARVPPVHPPQHVLGGQQQPLLQPGGHHRGQAPAQMRGHRGGGGGGEHPGEVQAAELAQLDVGDHRGDEAPAVGLLFLAVAHRPRPPPQGAAGGVEVVVDEGGAGRAGPVGGPAPGQPRHQLGRLGQRLVAGAGGGVAAVPLLHPPQPPVAVGAGRRVGPHPAVELEDLSSRSYKAGRRRETHRSGRVTLPKEKFRCLGDSWGKTPCQRGGMPRSSWSEPVSRHESTFLQSRCSSQLSYVPLACGSSPKGLLPALSRRLFLL
jgi:hypothetical protein